MKISWTAAAATQFTVYMAVSNLGYAAGPMLTRLHLDDPSSYLAAAVVAFLPMPFLFLLRPEAWWRGSWRTKRRLPGSRRRDR